MKSTAARFWSGPIELLLDEVDEVLAADRLAGYPLLKTLRRARNHGLIRLTMCGREEPGWIPVDSYNPLQTEVIPIRLGTLESEDARKLLIEPLKHLGVQVDDWNKLSDTVERVSRGEPMCIQRWGLHIAEKAALDRQHRFCERDLERIRQEVKRGKIASMIGRR